MNEAELLRAFVGERSEAAFAALVRRYAGLVFSTAHRRLGNAALAEDITQMVFIRLAQKPPALRSSAELAAWLHRTTVHVTIDLWRAETRRRTRELEATLMETAPANTVVWEEISPKVDEALNQLREDDRQVLTLRFFSGKTMREVGTLLGVSEDAAKMRVSRAVERLRTQLGVGATACPATVLAVLLGERAAEAVPAPLLARLAAIKVPVAAGIAGGGLLALLLRTSKLKLAAGAAAALVVGTVAFHFAHSPGQTASGDGRSLNSPATGTAQTTGRAAYDRLARINDAARSSRQVVPEPKVKMLFRVVDSQTGRPLGNTQVHVAAFGPGGHGESHDLVTDSNGTAPIPEPNDPAKKTMNVFVVAEGHVPKSINFQSHVQLAEYTVKLDPATTLSGTVVDEAGQPVGGVRIEMRSPGSQGAPSAEQPNEDIDFQTCPVTNREDGTWTFGYLPLDYTNEVNLNLTRAGYAATQLTVPVGTLGRSNLFLVIDRGFTVAGRIADSNNAPIAGANIGTLLIGGRTRQLTAKTDQEGRFSLAGVTGDPEESSGSYVYPPPETNANGQVMVRGLSTGGPLHVELAIQAGGFASQKLAVPLTAATNRVDVELSAGKVIGGRVLDEDGVPLPNAVAQTDWNNQGIRVFEWTSRTDVSGRFRWDSAPDGPALFWFEAEGYLPERMVELRADGTDHEIRLKRSRPNEAAAGRGPGASPFMNLDKMRKNLRGVWSNSPSGTNTPPVPTPGN